MPETGGTVIEFVSGSQSLWLEPREVEVSKEELAERLMKFLADADAATGWCLTQTIAAAPAPTPPSLTEQFFSWLRRHA